MKINVGNGMYILTTPPIAVLEASTDRPGLLGKTDYNFDLVR